MEKIRFKSHKVKSNHTVLRYYKVDSYGALVFAPDQSAAVLAAKLYTNSYEHSMCIIFLWLERTLAKFLPQLSSSFAFYRKFIYFLMAAL